jgi:hypothetical protein
MRLGLQKALKENKIIVMDEKTIEYAEDYYKGTLLFSRLHNKIVRIFVEDSGYNEFKLNEKIVSKTFNILAIARAEFPFKGYLLGLVRDFPKYADYQTYLDIVSYGPDIKKLKDELLILNESYKGRVKIHGKKTHKELFPYFDSSNVYVGMGTTILDAAVRKVISIPIQSYTDKVFASNYFHLNYRNVVDDGKGHNNFAQLIQGIRNMNEMEYKKACNESRDIVLQYYEAKKNTSLLLKFINESPQDDFCFIYALINFLKKIKKMV